MQNLVNIDLFGMSALVRKVSDSFIYESKYFIEYVNGLYFCYVQRRKAKGRWSKKTIVEKSNNRIFIDYADSELGVMLK
ncbi:hypothetical protein [Fluviispira vulneris]|uniref:hypothetical protein n=1 Tax=Fluviispira vulneris TaxID=2763012 RepID=UPI001647DE5B|nr:hypothetical protein [Fluviispira vulneris]